MSTYHTAKIVVSIQQSSKAVQICGFSTRRGRLINQPSRQYTGVLDHHARKSCNLCHVPMEAQRSKQIPVELCNSSASAKSVGHKDEKLHSIDRDRSGRGESCQMGCSKN